MRLLREKNIKRKKARGRQNKKTSMLGSKGKSLNWTQDGALSDHFLQWLNDCSESRVLYLYSWSCVSIKIKMYNLVLFLCSDPGRSESCALVSE